MLTPHVYRQATLTNKSDFVLLPGEATMYLGSDFVGRGELPLVAIGKQFTVGFGVDPQVQVSRQLLTKDRKTTGGNQVLTFDYRILVNSYKAEPVKLQVWDRLPKAEAQAVAVSLVSQKPDLSGDALYVARGAAEEPAALGRGGAADAERREGAGDRLQVPPGAGPADADRHGGGEVRWHSYPLLRKTADLMSERDAVLRLRGLALRNLRIAVRGYPMTHVVVVEDEPAIRRGVVDVLRLHGYDVTEAADGDAGLAAALRRDVGLVLLDLLLPRRDGLDVLAELRKVRPTLPVIVLTARGTEDDRVRGLRMGADDYVVKPFSARELLARVEAVLRRSPHAAPQTTGADARPGEARLPAPRGRLARAAPASSCPRRRRTS